MKKLSNQKRNQLILVVAAALVVLVGLYFFLILPQFQSLNKIAANRQSVQLRLEQINNAIKNTKAIEAERDDLSNTLNNSEADMASGDLYSWTYDTIRRFKGPYRVDIPEIGQPVVSDVDMLPDFPYKQVKFTIHGTAYYHDLGKFVADFENTFPYARIVNLALDSSGDDSAGAAEKLSFRMNIVALVKANRT